MNTRNFFSIFTIAFLSLATFATTGCKEDSVNVAAENLASQDAADVIAGEVGTESGGINDQLTDMADFNSSPVFSMQESGAFENGVSENHRYGRYVKTYNPTTQTWTVVIESNFTGANRWKSWKRGYEYSFSKNNVKQQFFVVGGVMADTINFRILTDSCRGEFTSPRVSHKLKTLSGSIVAAVSISGADTLLTVNSATPRVRSAVDTITVRNSVRTSDHTLTATLNNVVVPMNLAKRLPEKAYQGRRIRNARPISGTISGDYTAFMTFQRGDSYSEREVNRQFTITFGNNSASAEVGIKVTGSRGGSFEGSFNLETGELNSVF
jgi:hypothetical protein